jgi:hypothetical protein
LRKILPGGLFDRFARLERMAAFDWFERLSRRLAALRMACPALILCSIKSNRLINKLAIMAGVARRV